MKSSVSGIIYDNRIETTETDTSNVHVSVVLEPLVLVHEYFCAELVLICKSTMTVFLFILAVSSIVVYTYTLFPLKDLCFNSGAILH